MSISCYRSIGEIKNECDVWFTYRENSNSWGIRHGFPYEIDMLDGSTRSVIIKKTRMIVCVDEDETGNPVTETWGIKKHFLHAH